MPTIKELRDVRVKKLKKVGTKGIEAYPLKTKRNCSINSAIDNFADFAKEEKEIILAGRILTIRQHGGSTFLHFQDGSNRIQAFFNKNRLGEKSYDFFIDTFDIGDFIEIKGTLFKTKTEEKTIQVSDYKILAKSLHPLPEKWHGLQDIEERYRKRYQTVLLQWLSIRS